VQLFVKNRQAKVESSITWTRQKLLKYPHPLPDGKAVAMTIMNFKINQNFFNFINVYREEELKKRLENPKYKILTFLGMAFDCGYNSNPISSWR